MRRDPFTRLNQKTVYRNRWLSVEVHGITHPNGAAGEHVGIVTPQACGVLVEDNGYLLFARQPRFAAQQYVTEIVKGGSSADESPLESAKRELREELGVTAHSWLALGTVREIPSIVNPPVVLFLARELTYGAPQPSDEESITMVRLTIAGAVGAAINGEIDDAVTIAALFRFAATFGYLLPPPDNDQYHENHDCGGGQRKDYTQNLRAVSDLRAIGKPGYDKRLRAPGNAPRPSSPGARTLNQL